MLLPPYVHRGPEHELLTHFDALLEATVANGLLRASTDRTVEALNED